VGGEFESISGYEFESCKEKFFLHLDRMCYSVETYKGYEKDLQFFQRFMSKRKQQLDFQMEDILKEDLLMFMDYGREMGHKPNTIARRMSTLKSFYKFIVNELDYPVDVAARIHLPKAYIPLLDILTEQEMKLLLAFATKLTSTFKCYLLYRIKAYTCSYIRKEKRIFRRPPYLLSES
jgi:site-specific recombinase XerD